MSRSESPGCLFDEIVHRGASATEVHFEEGEGEASTAFRPIALPRSSVSPSSLRRGDLVVQRALGEGKLACLKVLGEDIELPELYASDGLLRADTLILRDPARPGRAAGSAELFAEAGTGPFQIRVTDPAWIKPQAKESKYRFSGDRVQIELERGGVEVAAAPAASGLFEPSSRSSTRSTVGLVYRATGSRSYLRWRIVSGGGVNAAQAGAPHTVEISTRLRLSLWAFVPPFTSVLKGDTIELDSAQLALLREAEVDDLSLVYTLTWDKRDKLSDRPKPPQWHEHFKPAGQPSEAHRVNYLKALIAALHPKIQVIPGFELVRATPDKNKPPPSTEKELKAAKKDAALAATAADFAAWLLSAKPDEIRAYAQSIHTFFASRGLDVDGLGYDFEFDGLTEAHRSNLGLLYRETSNAFAHRNGIVSYANAPFKEDGVNTYGFMKAQPFSLAASGLNLLARPMCFDAKNSTSVSDIEASIACALRDPADTSAKGGAGLHPSQVQFGIWVDKLDEQHKAAKERAKAAKPGKVVPVPDGAEAFCTNVLRPNRIGLMVYNLPGGAAAASATLNLCKLLNAALNPNEGPAGQDSQPLQVPRGTAAWPPPAAGRPAT